MKSLPPFFSPRGMQQPFGRRDKVPVAHASFAQERLREVLAELVLLFNDVAFPQAPLPFLLEGTVDPMVIVGHYGRISIDGSTGMYVFTDDDPVAQSISVTSSVERLLDFVLSYLARRQAEAVAPDTKLAYVEKCIGHSIDEVERALILATLRHCRGNRARTSQLLGISLQALRSRLRGYWRDILAQSPPGAGGDR